MDTAAFPIPLDCKTMLDGILRCLAIEPRTRLSQRRHQTLR
jgi:hypothetical protein